MFTVSTCIISIKTKGPVSGQLVSPYLVAMVCLQKLNLESDYLDGPCTFRPICFLVYIPSWNLKRVGDFRFLRKRKSGIEFGFEISDSLPRRKRKSETDFRLLALQKAEAQDRI